MDTYVNWRACAHGIAADEVRLYRDEAHHALYIKIDKQGDMSIRVQLTPHANEDPTRRVAELERDRKGLRRLAAIATQVAQEIERMQRSPDATTPPDGAAACTCDDPDCPDPVHQSPAERSS